ncbi:hypothetical protein FRC14_005822 [Serendipita sp. 396]|nr:hypothetical protein FRC14_005822 [Serendipita sp. 396]KAG8777447.1 hypothetical protein FRC15_011338 [Serendipita sp. 397]
MDQWGGGDGSSWKIGNDSQHPFVGRDFGGAKRKDIGGTRAFGSGYPYGADDPTTLAGRSFPFGTWPLYWGENFMGADEYGSHLDVVRPGGQLVVVPIQSSKQHYNVSDDEVYYAIGDKESATFLMLSYVDWCHALPAWPTKFDPTSPNSTVKLEQVIRYYRGSSFALSSPAYNNTFARSSFSNSTESSPLPDLVEYSPFRKCLDGVTISALAIMNKPPKKVSLGVTLGIVFGILGIPAILFIIYISSCAWGAVLAIKDHINGVHERTKMRREARKAALNYESYP